MLRRVTAILFTIGIIVAGCSPAEPETVIQEVTVIAEVPVTIEVTREIEVERVVEVTQMVEVTRLSEVTRVVELPVTVTYTSTPVNSPTPSSTPTITPTPTDTPIPTDIPTAMPSATATATPDLAATATIEAYGVLAAPKGNGFFTVGAEILAGKWRSNGTSNDCYWARYDANQNLLDNHFGFAGGTVQIRPSDYEVEFNDCGSWEYVENETPSLQNDATSPKGNGFYTVGLEIAPGTWESTGTEDSCYWARLNSGQDLLDNHFGNAGGTVTIRPSDYEVVFNDCGVWEYRGP